MNMIEMKRTRAEALAKAEAILTTAEQRGGAMTAPEQENYRTSMSEFEALSATVPTFCWARPMRMHRQ
jgi:hypothetical protein